MGPMACMICHTLARPTKLCRQLRWGTKLIMVELLGPNVLPLFCFLAEFPQT
jgi:hypothetical protein